MVRFVCDNLDEMEYCFVNLRKAKTVFGCANLVLAELGESNLKNAQGINMAIEKIGQKVEQLLGDSEKKLFVLVLDELDALFMDKRGKPSDFVYKLVVLEEKLRNKGYMMCIVGISNNVMTEFDLDDRVRSRIGSSEVFFEAYSKKGVLAILKDRARVAFSEKIEASVLDYCANMSSLDHGDARRAVDLLRVAAEIASKKKEKLSSKHIDAASAQLQKNRVELILSTSSYQFKLVASALARITFLSGEVWHSTSSIFKQYEKILGKEVKPLTYRRVSEILVELQNTGIALSQTASKGRHGYGTQYRLNVSPETIGNSISSEWWNSLKEKKDKFESSKNEWDFLGGRRRRGRGLVTIDNTVKKMKEDMWKNFSGLDS